MRFDLAGGVSTPEVIGPGQLAVEEVSDRAAVASLAPEWEDLIGRTGRACFFSSREWLDAWLASFRTEQPLALLLARRGSTLVGLLPLLEGTRGWLCGGSGGLEGPVNEQTPCGSLLCEGDPAPILAAFLGHVRRTRGRVPLHLPLFAADGAPVQALREIAAEGRYRVAEKPSRCSARVLAHGSWSDYLATRSKHAQREWRRKRKRLDEAGRVEIRTVTAAAELPGALQEVIDVESRSWKHGEGTSFQRETGVEDFYRRLAEGCAARGWLRLFLLYLDGRPAAHCFAVVYGGELLALKTSFAAELANLSPGLALMLAVSELAFGEGLAAVDLLGHPDRWKLEMANEQRPHVDLCVFPRAHVRCGACVFLEERVEPILKEKLPPRVAQAGRELLARVRHRG